MNTSPYKYAEEQASNESASPDEFKRRNEKIIYMHQYQPEYVPERAASGLSIPVLGTVFVIGVGMWMGIIAFFRWLFKLIAG